MRPIKADFPALNQTIHGRPVVYLDSASSAQKPQVVLDAMNQVMQEHYANVHRGLYSFATRTTISFEKARQAVAEFLHADSSQEIVFTRNATEGINLVAAAWGQRLISGDEIILTELEHHANIVPWYMLAQRTGAILKVIPILKNGALDVEAFARLLSPRTKLLAITQMSNVLGTVTPLRQMIAKAKEVGAMTLVDGSQGAVHLHTDVQDLGCDFYVFTSHKLYGPTGLGVLYGRSRVLEDLPPYQGGGEMIEEVRFDHITFKSPPYRFEAGTPPIVEAIGLKAAIDYIQSVDRNVENNLLQIAEEALQTLSGVRLYSCAPERSSILSFTIDQVHPHDAATVFDQLGICVRAGHHCAQPLMRALGVTATLRASFGIYNEERDIERLIEGIKTVQRLLA